MNGLIGFILGFVFGLIAASVAWAGYLNHAVCIEHGEIFVGYKNNDRMCLQPDGKTVSFR